MAKYKRVFQMGFDIAESDEVEPHEAEQLFTKIEGVISSFNTCNGTKIKFLSIGEFNAEDMSHVPCYSEEELNKII